MATARQQAALDKQRQRLINKVRNRRKPENANAAKGTSTVGTTRRRVANAVNRAGMASIMAPRGAEGRSGVVRAIRAASTVSRK